MKLAEAIWSEGPRRKLAWAIWPEGPKDFDARHSVGECPKEVGASYWSEARHNTLVQTIYKQTSLRSTSPDFMKYRDDPTALLHQPCQEGRFVDPWGHGRIHRPKQFFHT